MKIRNFNEGTLVGKHNHLEYIINVDLCHISDIDEIRYDLTEPNELFLKLKIYKRKAIIFISFTTLIMNIIPSYQQKKAKHSNYL